MSITIVSRHRTRTAKQILVWLPNNRLSILTYRKTVNRTPMDHYTSSICKIIKMLAPSTNVCQKLVKFVIYLVWCVRNRLIAQLCIPLQRHDLHTVEVPDRLIGQVLVDNKKSITQNYTCFSKPINFTVCFLTLFFNVIKKNIYPFKNKIIKQLTAKWQKKSSFNIFEAAVGCFSIILYSVWTLSLHWKW